VDFIDRHDLRAERRVTHRSSIEETPDAFWVADTATTGRVLFIWP
jgi:hypothetical protein